MLDQDDVEVIDDSLAGKENDGLQSFQERNGDPPQAEGSHDRAGKGGKIRYDHSQHAGEDGAFHTQTQCNQDERSDQANHTFEHEIECQRTEGVDPLDIPTPHTQRYVKSYP